MKDKQTIGQWLKWDFEANGVLKIQNKQNKYFRLLYQELSNGFWEKGEYDSKGKKIYYEDSTGFWVKREYDSQGNKIYYEDSDGCWIKYEYDSQGNEIYYEDSDGRIIDNRPPEIIEHNGHKYQLMP